MIYQPVNYNHLLGLKGFSDQLLTDHFTLYRGYVESTNQIIERLYELAKDAMTQSPEYGELSRRFGWEFNGMRLHEYYFSSMTKNRSTLDQGSNLFALIQESFGSYEEWERDFKATGSLRGIGWAILYYEPIGDRVLNVWVNEHDAGHLAGAAPLLVMDVFEHAFIQDYSLDRADYIEAFFNVIDWATVVRRLNIASNQKMDLGAKGVEMALIKAGVGSR